MTSCYEYEDALQNLEAIMDEAWVAGYVKIRHRTGREFMLRPWQLRSPLDELEVALEVERLAAEALHVEQELEAQVGPGLAATENGRAA